MLPPKEGVFQSTTVVTTLRSRHGQPFLQQQYQLNSSQMRPMGNHHNGQSAWSNYGMDDGVPWGNSTSFVYIYIYGSVENLLKQCLPWPLIL
jgi:hypothetical protein